MANNLNWHLIWETFVGLAGCSIQWYGILAGHTFPLIIGTILAMAIASRLWTGVWIQR
jgi:hypothetical protein